VEENAMTERNPAQRDATQRKGASQGGITTCVSCRHFRNALKNQAAPEVWYNLICTVSPLPTSVDPVSGKISAFTTNSFGQTVFVDDEFAYCQDVNKGNCPKYEGKR
jgi:hypothetical protein